MRKFHQKNTSFNLLILLLQMNLVDLVAFFRNKSKLNIIVFFIITLFSRLYVYRVAILLTFGKHLHHGIVSLRGEV